MRHTFTVELNRKQTEAIRKEWNQHGKNSALMIAQLLISAGPFQCSKGQLEVFLLDLTERNTIAAMLAQQPEPAPEPRS